MNAWWERAEVAQGMRRIGDCLGSVVDEAIAICKVPAPTFEEAERARFVAQRMQALGLGVPHSDAEGNVICELEGSTDRTIMVTAHLDTVFGRETPLEVRRDGNRLYGPGIGDNSLAVAALLWLGHVLVDLPDRGTLVMAANVGEEGLGDLRGAKELWRAYGSRAHAWVALEGALGSEAVHHGVASRRLRISYRTTGGHSWRDFGRPSAIHAMGDLIALVTQIAVPLEPKTTYNVGVVEGGRSVNTIAPAASILLDMRSEDTETLKDLESRVVELARSRAQRAGVEADIEVMGDRPGGRLPRGHWLLGLVDRAAEKAGLSLKWKSASTDANVPLSHGAPAVTLGIGRGENLHSVEEVLDLAMARQGLQMNFLVLASLLSDGGPGS
jgi:acetylornithine deacetylase/succinyl-diaminopimelate desuccinylase-like protein